MSSLHAGILLHRPAGVCPPAGGEGRSYKDSPHNRRSTDLTEDLRRAYATLDLSLTASAEQVRQAYRDLVRVWHPDRYHQEAERVREKAQNKLKEISLAYARLRQEIGDDTSVDLTAMDFGELWGFVDSAGRAVIYPEYQAARSFREGLAAVKAIEKWGFIDVTGRYRATPLYEDCGDFHEGLAAVKWYKRWGFVDPDGVFVIQPRFQEVSPFDGGWARVRLGSRWGRINRAGEVLFEHPSLAGHLEE